ncbi:MAG: isopeptide-forming domain-containing fimbrial protein [Gemmiger sp.]
MKTAKRLLTAALAVVFTFMCALPAMADDLVDQKTYTLTIDNPAAEHTYEAYQIFDGYHTKDVTSDYLSDINWGSGITRDADSQAKMISKLKEAGLYDENTAYVDKVNDATKVAMALSKLEDKAEKVDEFNEIVGAYLDAAAGSVKAETTDSVQFTGLSAGYYLVKDADTDSVGANESYTKYLVKLVADAKMQIKSQSMSLDKYILSGNDKVKANNAAMGDTVNYRLESQLSEMDGYEAYTFIIHDELDAGLTFNNNDVSVKVGPKKDDPASYKTYENVTIKYAKQADGTYTSDLPKIEKGETLYICITLNGLTQDYKNQYVSVTYSATVNENANIGSTPNNNKAYLEYSNNPNQSQGQQEKTSTTTTPPQTVSTYVAGIEISKVSPKGNLLPGAQFMITAKDGTDKDAIKELNVTGYSFKEAGDAGEGNYYYKEGESYVTAVPEDAAAQKYVTQDGTNLKKGDKIVGMTGDGVGQTAQGVLRFDGLKAGTYTITEVLAPTGYRKIDQDITLKVEWLYSETTKEYYWEYSVESAEGDAVPGKVTNGILPLKIVNQHGLTLPFTGGEGANLLAGLGLALMAAAVAAILYIKRRQNRE